MAENAAPRADYPAPGDGRRGSRWRTAYWSATVFFLLAPLIAMQFTDEVDWSVGDFVFAGALFFGVGVAYEASVKETDSATHRWVVRLALATAFLLVWATGAVGLIGAESNAANLLYYGVLAVGAVGTVVAHFRSQGMALAMAATAIAQAAVAVGALVGGWGGAATGPSEVVVINGVFVALWAGSAALFQRAASPTSPPQSALEA